MEEMGGIMVPLILLPLVLVNFKSSTFVHMVLQTSCDIVITFSIVCCCLFFNEFLDHPAQNMYQNSTPWKALWNYLFNECSLIPNGLQVVLLRHCALSRDISERAALKDFTITLHTDLQNSWFLMRWKVDLMDIQNNLLFSHGTSVILDEKLITTVILWRWWWSDRMIFFAGILHTYCLNKHFFSKNISL